MSEISREEAIKELTFLSNIVNSNNAKGTCDKAISDMEKLEKIEQIIKKYDLQDIIRDDVDNIISGFEYEIIMAVLGKDITK